MSAAIPFIFGTMPSGNVPASDLDADFALLANANTFSNYLVDAGVANVYVVTLGANQTCTLVAGLAVQFKALASNTGASTLDVNGTGVRAIVNSDGSALSANQINAGGIISVMYTGAVYMLVGQSVNYAEGDWTPAVGGTATYTLQFGKYTKIGRLVYIIGSLGINVLGTGSATTISGLPFTVTNPGPFSVSNWISLAATYVNVVGRPVAGTKTMIFNTAAAATATLTGSAALMGNSSAMEFAGFYLV